MRNKDEWRKAATDRQRGLWQLLDGVIAGRRRRSKVDPAEGLEPLQFRIKGSLMYEDNDDRLPLCVMNRGAATSLPGVERRDTRSRRICYAFSCLTTTPPPLSGAGQLTKNQPLILSKLA